MSRLDKFKYTPIKPPFDNEAAQAKAMKRVFGSDEGKRVLDSLILDMDYHRPDLPVGADQLAFNAGKRYCINHILHAIAAEYKTTDEEEND